MVFISTVDRTYLLLSSLLILLWLPFFVFTSILSIFSVYWEINLKTYFFPLSFPFSEVIVIP